MKRNDRKLAYLLAHTGASAQEEAYGFALDLSVLFFPFREQTPKLGEYTRDVPEPTRRITKAWRMH